MIKFENICYVIAIILLLINLFMSCMTAYYLNTIEAKITTPVVTVIAEPTEESTIEETSETTTEESTIETTTEEPTEESTFVVNEEDAELLAMAIYQEVGGDAACDDCRRRVADVILNRVDSDKYPNTIEKVLTQYGQYGNFSQTGVVWAARASNPLEAHAVERARRIAREVLQGQHSELYGEGYVYQSGFIQGREGFWCCGHYFAK